MRAPLLDCRLVQVVYVQRESSPVPCLHHHERKSVHRDRHLVLTLRKLVDLFVLARGPKQGKQRKDLLSSPRGLAEFAWQSRLACTHVLTSEFGAEMGVKYAGSG